MTRLFRYILTHDYGMAPCVDNGLLTLAACKPRIRGAAKEGDWVAGFCSVSSDPKKHRTPGRLAYIGCVAEILPVGEYQRLHRRRSDAIYRRKSDGSFRRKRPEYHDDPVAIRRDLSADVLVFKRGETWYFGRNAVLLPDEFQPLFAVGIGHKLGGASEKDIEHLIAWVREHWPSGLHGTPCCHLSVAAQACGRPSEYN